MQTGETTAKVEALEESSEEIVVEVESIKNTQKWTDQSIDHLFQRVNDLENKIVEVKEETLEEVEEVVEEEGGEETIIENETLPTEEEKNTIPWGTMLGTVVFGVVSVFLIKLFEDKKGGDYEL
jgi:uncharacterized coiled-coil DUF342 family protein